jgi:tyrosyl-tRNA synthetase
LKKILKSDIQVLNNNDWMKNFSFIDFMRDEGKYFRLSTMLAKENVKLRLQSESGMSFTEFSYQAIQGYDFYHLFKDHGIEVQMGGSDQWGNITAGIEFARKKGSASLYGLTFPLITRSDGKKFGKSESGAIWLDEKKISPYQFYQHLFNMPDSDVIRLLKMLTFLSLEEIKKIEDYMLSSDYIPNFAQKRLAEEVTRFVHGEEGVKIAQKVTEGVQPGKEIILDANILKEISKDMPSKEMKLDEVLGMKFSDMIVNTDLTSSKSEAVKLIKNGGAYLNNIRIEDVNLKISDQDLIEREFLVIGKGKKKKILIKIKN